MAIDPYVYAGTNVLKNLPGIQELDRLQRFEAVSTADRISELHVKPIGGIFDTAHLRNIHQHIFRDVYSWAGQFRTMDIHKVGEFWFCRHQFIQDRLAELLNELSREHHLAKTTLHEFGARAGHYMTELNAIHPFREGNGRAQREFIRELGLNSGLAVNWAQVSQDEMYSASIAGFQKGDSQPMADLIRRITSVIPT